MGLPKSVFVVGSFPGCLVGMAYPPQNLPWLKLHEMGVQKVVCLCNQRPNYHPNPCEFGFCTDLEDLVGGFWPEDPEAEGAKVNAAVDATLRLISANTGTVVHCIGGRGRTGTVIGGVLVRLGMPVADVQSYLDGLSRQAGKDGWPESPWAIRFLETLA